MHETNIFFVFGKTLFCFPYVKFCKFSIFTYCQFGMRFYFLQLLFLRFSFEVFEPIYGQTLIRFAKLKSPAINLVIYYDK